MKTKFISSFAALIMSISSYSQIKVFSGGSVSIGAVTSPTANAVTHQIVGGKIVFPASTSSITSAPLIQGNNGFSSASAPDFSWLGDANTGMYHPGNNTISFATSGTERFRFASTGQLLCANTSGSQSLPDYSWTGDSNTGLFNPAADVIGFTTGGSERVRITNSYQILNNNGTPSSSTPEYSWNLDSNTGIFRPANDNIGFSTGGNERMRLNSVGTLSVGTTTDNPACTFSVTLNSDWASLTSATYVNRANSGNYQVILNGTTKFYVAGQGWIYSDGNYLGSDKNIKDDIKGIDSAMAKVKKIKGVLYKLKTEKQNPNVYGSAGEYMGVIAQDVEAVAPQVVKTLPDGTKAVCYEMLVGLLIEALKEQNAKINQLESAVSNCCTQGNPKNNRLITAESNTNESYTGSSYIKQNVPNPFNKETTIEYFIAERNAASSILVFDMTGKLLKTYKLNGNGQGNLTISGYDLALGMYYYSLIVDTREVGTKKMILTE